MTALEVGGREVGAGGETFIIAEAGSNHNGELETAKSLVDAAADAGADAVKFQTFRADDLFVEDSGTLDSPSYDDRPLYEIIESMEMPYEWIPTLHEYCEERGVLFLSTPFDERSADQLEPYVPAFKVASFTLSHHPFLRHLAGKQLPVIMSTGAHSREEVHEAVDVLTSSGLDQLALLHCVSAYPTPLEDINVRVVDTLRTEFDVPVGLSDHTTDPTTAPAAAVALGASVVEKHFTLDKSMEGPDHHFALDPDELEDMVTSIRKTELALGSGDLTLQAVEEETSRISRRAIHATTAIQAGDRITADRVKILRSGRRKRGLPPKQFESVVGRTAAKDIEKDQGVTWDDIE